MDAKGFIQKLAEVILNPTITLLFAVAILIFVWGLVDYIRGADDPGKRKEGAQHMFWGIIGLFIMISAAKILELFVDSVLR